MTTDQHDMRKALAEAYDAAVRNRTLEEVAQRIEREFKFPFGEDTVASFAVFIRRMKDVKERD
jgi:hypothetical protein